MSTNGDPTAAVPAPGATFPGTTQRLIELGNQWVQDIYFDDDNAEEVVHVHYEHELDKKFTVGSLVGLGFSLMNVPFGIGTTLSIGLVCGSSVTIFWGWILFGVFSLLISLSLSEISSKFPTSGGVYHFASLLASDKNSLIFSWYVGWYLVIGNLLMFVSCAFGGAQFVLSMTGITQNHYKRDDVLILIIFLIIVLASALVNLKFQRKLETFNVICIYWTACTIIVAGILILFYAKEFHNFGDIITHFDASRSGWPGPVAFIIGGIQFPALTYNGYGAIVAMSEEVKKPEKNIPKGLMISIVSTIFTGLAFIIPLLSVLPSLDIFDENPDMFPIDIIFEITTGSNVVSFAIVLMIVGALVFATVGSLTTVSRMIFSLGRDHGLPYNQLWQEVDTTEEEEHVPKNALLLATVVSTFLGCFSLISSSAFNAFIGCSVISMNLANGIPILLSLLNKRKKVRGATFKLRKFGYVVNLLSCLVVCVTIVVLSMPPSLDIDIQSMNYAFAVFFIFTLFITVAYFVWGRYHFTGPQIEQEAIPLTASTIMSEADRVQKREVL